MEFYSENAHFSSGFQLLEKRTVPIQFSNVRPHGFELSVANTYSGRVAPLIHRSNRCSDTLLIPNQSGFHDSRRALVPTSVAFRTFWNVTRP